jgi:hypothetical protein
MELWELVARERCRDTLAQYTHAGDRFRMDEYGAAFCEDGVLEIRGSTPVVGRAAIVETVSAATGSHRLAATATTAESAATAPPAARTKRIVRHNVTNVCFESISSDEATVTSYFTVFTEIGLDHMGRYRDRLVPVGDRWLIARRFVSVDWRAPDTTFGGGEGGSGGSGSGGGGSAAARSDR